MWAKADLSGKTSGLLWKSTSVDVWTQKLGDTENSEVWILLAWLPKLIWFLLLSTVDVQHVRYSSVYGMRIIVMAYGLHMPSSPPIGPKDCGDQELISLESTHLTVWAVLVFRIGEGNGNPLQYPCLENPMDRGAWQAIIHRFAKNDLVTEQQQLLESSSFCVCKSHFPTIPVTLYNTNSTTITVWKQLLFHVMGLQIFEDTVCELGLPGNRSWDGCWRRRNFFLPFFFLVD